MKNNEIMNDYEWQGLFASVGVLTPWLLNVEKRLRCGDIDCRSLFPAASINASFPVC
ncbi:MAG: hypothetical protein KTR17_01010 [Cellvibrionaceae bacterium]|nr:hypothetical protein [Cellvibrionaceae bacterium]